MLYINFYLSFISDTHILNPIVQINSTDVPYIPNYNFLKQIKYKGYFTKEKESVKKLKKLEAIKINDDFEYEKLHSMSAEGKEKLKKIRPKNMGQASRISGVSASDINILLIYITK